MKRALILMIGILSCLLAIVSCKQQEQPVETVAAISPDSMIAVWNSSWNNKDSATLAGMFTDASMVVFSPDEKFMGRDSIMVNWINNNMPKVANLRTERIGASASAEMAYFTGSYSLDIMRNDTILAQDMGSFTTIWKLQEDKSWKIDMMFFGPEKAE